MTEVSLTDPMDSMIREKPSHQSPLRVTAVVPFNPPPASTQPEETLQSTLKPIRMNVDVVDDTMRDLDPFSPASKALVLCLQPLAVREVIDLDLVHADNTLDDRDSDPNEPELNFDLDLVPQWRKGKKRLPRSLDASFDVGTTLAPPNTRSKDNEGPSIAKRGREGTSRKDKERATLAEQKQSHGSDIKEQIRAHLERELEKKKKKEPSSRSALYLKAVRQAQEVVYKEYVASIPFTNNFEKKMSQMPTYEDGNVAFFVQPNVDATNCGSLVRRDSVVNSRAKGL